MNFAKRRFTRLVIPAVCLVFAGNVLCQTAAQPAAQAAARPVGTVKAISGNSITLNSDSGGEVTVMIQDGARILRPAPGSKDLKDAAAIQVQDLQIGDRMVVVRGEPAADGKSVNAASVIVMKGTDVAKTQAQERDDWQRRGIGGLVKTVDIPSQSITISTTPNNSIVVHASQNTGFLRYAADSVKFSDAKKSTIDEVKTGDQLRARGARSADGRDFTADEVISGSFRNIAGTVNAVDAANGKITVMDLLTKKVVTIKVSGLSQLHKLPEPVAIRLAKLLKGPAQNSEGGSSPAAGEKPADGQANGQAAAPPDLQQILSRTPAMALADLQKGDAVMVVTTPSTAGSDLTAVTLVAGVEPILTAAPSGSGAASLLSAWNMSAGDAQGGD